MNYTLHDLIFLPTTGALFGLILYVPGYTLAWFSNLFAFRRRTFIVRSAIAVVLSTSVCPIVNFWLVRYGSFGLAYAAYVLTWLGFLGIVWKEKAWKGMAQFLKLARTERMLQIGLVLLIGCEIITLISVVDVQIGDRLYFDSIAYDHSQRAAITDAITRAGVPPVIPVYYPGQSVRVMSFYFSNYLSELLSSMIEQFDRGLFSARDAQLGFVFWGEIILVSGICLFFRLSRPNSSNRLKLQVVLGCGLLLVMGLDEIPIMLNMGHWDDQITPWSTLLLWDPHHAAGFVSALITYLILQQIAAGSFRRIYWLWIVFAGMGLASSFGLSTLVTLIFAAFFPIWAIAETVHRRTPGFLFIALCTGVLTVVLIAPFLANSFQSNQSGTGSAVLLEIRTLIQGPASGTWPAVLIAVLALPVIYIAELGFFLLAGFSYWRWLPKEQRQMTEVYLLLISVLIASFVRSIPQNDIGWRAFIPAQFILLIWSTDVLIHIFRRFFKGCGWESQFTGSVERWWRTLLIVSLGIGLVSNIYTVIAYRLSNILVDTSLASLATYTSARVPTGRQTYDLHLAYDFIRTQTPMQTTIQYNPDIPDAGIEYPSGLYTDRQVILGPIVDQRVWAIPITSYRAIAADLQLFFADKPASQHDRQVVCKRYGLDLLVLKDTDPVWQDNTSWIYRTTPLFTTPTAVVFRCGDG